MKILLAFVFLLPALGNAQDNHDHHSHEGHLHEQMVDGEKIEVDVELSLIHISEPTRPY